MKEFEQAIETSKAIGEEMVAKSILTQAAIDAKKEETVKAYDYCDLMEKWTVDKLTLEEANHLITILIVDNAKLERGSSEIIIERDHWEDKATELANMVGAALGFDVGEHSNLNCPVQTAIDGVFEMRAQIEVWKNHD